MTFTLPEDVASQLLRRVPARDRSRYVTQAIVARLLEREQRLIQACETANNDREVQSIEGEWEALRDEIAEPWSDAPAR
jgi:hypothetical protein